MYKINQKGSAVAVGLVAVLVIATVGVGCYIYSVRENTNSKAKTFDAAAKVQQTEVTYLKIPELGLKIKLNPDVKDANYSKLNANNVTVDSSYGLSTTALDALGGNCSAANGSGSRIVTSDSKKRIINDGPKDVAFGEVFPNATNINGKFYALDTRHQNAFCSRVADDATTKTEESLTRKVFAGFKASTIEKL